VEKAKARSGAPSQPFGVNNACGKKKQSKHYSIQYVCWLRERSPMHAAKRKTRQALLHPIRLLASHIQLDAHTRATKKLK
jgi:hypothetical protein